MNEFSFIPLPGYVEYPEEEMRERAATFYADMCRRRSVRHFSDRSIPPQVMEDCIHAANQAPSGAHKQPWHFFIVSDPETKHKIRIAAEKEERAFYSGRAPKSWLNDVAPFGTDENKPFLDTAPYLIAVFAQRYDLRSEDEINQNYYVSESVGIATGILITAIHHSGLVSLTHTPSPMRFLNRLLERPNSERP